jgi:DNA-binding NtrC family response regulator
MNHRRFSQVFLLCNSGNMFERAVQIREECDNDPDLPKVNLVHVEISDIIDHSGIYRSLLKSTSSLVSKFGHQNAHWSVLLDPGTPQMQTAWILLVKSGVFDATLIQGIPPKFNNGIYTCRDVDLSDSALPSIVSLGEGEEGIHEPVGKTKSPADVNDKEAGYEVSSKGFEKALAESDLVVRDKVTREVFQRAWQVAQYDHEHHLILGGTGTGKTMLAEWIHECGPRFDRPFHEKNCATLTAATAESELFGHKKGAFTGAESDRPGALRTADTGVLFLDEIGDLSLDLQARLLHVLDGRPFQPMGSDESVKVDIVVIAATNKDLHEMVEKGSFREDLFARLATVPLTMPSLRDRPQDLDAIVSDFLADWNLSVSDNRELAPEVMEILRRYNWPRNIRQLKSTLKQVCMMAPGETIVPEDLPPEILEEAGEGYVSRIPRIELPESGMKLKEFIAEVEKDLFRQALERTDGVAARAAELVGYEPATFRKALRERYTDLIS